MKYSSNFEGAVVEYEPWAVMSAAHAIFQLFNVMCFKAMEIYDYENYRNIV